MGSVATAFLAVLLFVVLPSLLIRAMIRGYGEASEPEKQALLLAIRALLLFGCTALLTPFFMYGALTSFWLPIAAATLVLTGVPTPMLALSLWHLAQLRALDTSRLRSVRRALLLTTPVSLLGGWWALSILRVVLGARQ